VTRAFEEAADFGGGQGYEVALAEIAMDIRYNGVHALPQDPSLVRDQHTVLVPECVHDKAAQIITYSIGIPHFLPQQPLHCLPVGS
jgi:hypothetical protein